MISSDLQNQIFETKFWWPKFWPNRAKLGPKLGSFPFSQGWFLEIVYSDSLEQCLTCISGKNHEKYFQDPNLGQRGQYRSKTRFFDYFLKFGSLSSLEIAYNDSLQQCPTCSRDKSIKKFSRFKIWAKRAKISPQT